MKYILALLFLICSLTTKAQKRDVLIIDSLPPQGILLNQGWKWHAGDDPDFVKTEFDDSAWESIDPTKDIMDLTQVRQAEIGYLRLHLWIDSALFGKALALKLYQIGASEIYLNGFLIQKIGRVSKNEEEEQTYVTDGHPYSIVFLKPGEQIISVRYSFTKSNFLIKLRPGTGLFNCFRATLAYLDSTVETYVKSKNDFSFLSYSKFGLFLFLGLLHLFFFISYPKQNAHLFVSLYALCQSCIYYIDNDKIWGIDGNAYFINTHLFIILSIFSTIFSLLTIYSYLKLAKNRTFWITFLLIVATYPICLYFTKSGWLYLMLGMSLVLEFEAINVSLKTIHQNNSGVKFIIAGWIIYTIFMGIFLLMVIKLLPSNIHGFNISYNIAVLSVPICYSLMLAGDYARTNRFLVAKLNEIETLSTEKQQILATQNEMLEKQVEERTTELKASQAQLIQSEKLASLGELTAGIAHEIQNPLNFVNNFAEVSAEMLDEMHEELEKGDTAEAIAIAADLKTNLEKINHHGQRASSIVKGMLEHSRASTGVKEPTDLNALADEYLRLAYHGLRAKDNNFNAKMETHFDPDLPKVSVIPQDIGRVLLNLINNAFYAVTEKAKEGIEGYQPTLTISSRKLENTIEIQVEDNGNGIPDAIKDKIFQPFFTTKPTGQGTGLGLSLAYDIVTKGHGGALEVKNDIGLGAIFVLILPL